jgi:hypothetical protein
MGSVEETREGGGRNVLLGFDKEGLKLNNLDQYSLFKALLLRSLGDLAEEDLT